MIATHVVDRRYVRVVEARHELSFTLQTLLQLCVAGVHPRVEHFERHRPVELRVARQVDGTHSAHTQGLDDDVSPHRVSRLEPFGAAASVGRRLGNVNHLYQLGDLFSAGTAAVDVALDGKQQGHRGSSIDDSSRNVGVNAVVRCDRARAGLRSGLKADHRPLCGARTMPLFRPGQVRVSELAGVDLIRRRFPNRNRKGTHDLGATKCSEPC